MEANLGWKPARSTKEYVLRNYPGSNDAWSEYLIGTYSHEIGHLFFGFGRTREEVSHSSALWFSLGLGMVYDMEVTSEIVGREPKLEVDIIRSWRDRYAKMKGFDQRLINPDRSADEKFDFDRTKVFGHGKATSFLKKLRIVVGQEQFDAAVKKYLSECGECRSGYEDFLNFLPGHKAAVAKVEQEFGVR